MKDKTTTIEQLRFDGKNFNKHTEYGMALLEKSLRQNGAGRSILVDRDNNIIAGNGIVEAAQNAGITKTRVVEVTGDELVVVKRTDLELDSKAGREMALADNATAAVDLQWDYEQLQAAMDEFDISPYDWGVALDEDAEAASGNASKEVDLGDTADKIEMKLLFTIDEFNFINQLPDKEGAILKALGYEPQV